MGVTKRKIHRDAALSSSKGATVGHYLQFISDTLDIMDELPNTKGFHIAIDNAVIHSHMNPLIIERSGQIKFKHLGKLLFFSLGNLTTHKWPNYFI